jgi:hypothetical protein
VGVPEGEAVVEVWGEAAGGQEEDVFAGFACVLERRISSRDSPFEISAVIVPAASSGCRQGSAKLIGEELLSGFLYKCK